MNVQLSTADTILIQHALGHYARIEGFRHNPDLVPSMKKVMERLEVQVSKATKKGGAK